MVVWCVRCAYPVLRVRVGDLRRRYRARTEATERNRNLVPSKYPASKSRVNKSVAHTWTMASDESSSSDEARHAKRSRHEKKEKKKHKDKDKKKDKDEDKRHKKHHQRDSTGQAAGAAAVPTQLSLSEDDYLSTSTGPESFRSGSPALAAPSWMRLRRSRPRSCLQNLSQSGMRGSWRKTCTMPAAVVAAAAKPRIALGTRGVLCRS